MLPLLIRSKGIPWYLRGGIPKANCLAAYQPKNAASYAASKVNRVNPGTYDLTNGVAYPSWAAATGWTFASASSQYLIIASALATAVPISIICRINLSVIGDYMDFLGFSRTDANNRFVLSGFGALPGDPIIAYVQNLAVDDFTAKTGTLSAGVSYSCAAVYAANNSRSVYINGGSKISSAVAVTPSGVNRTSIGGAYYAGAMTSFWSGAITACAFYNIALSDAQVLALHNAMAAL